jgi:23S rRNA (pseudouridine1915-N3)-methyltransferase
MASEYARRLRRFCDFRMQEVRSGDALRRQDRAFQVALDPAGQEMTSADLAALVARAEATAVREMVFLVGGADGLSDAARRNADLVLSLSRMTLPHELARVVLAEQLYRAFAILRRHPYAK